MSLYKLLSVLLCYPEQELLDNMTEIRHVLQAYDADTAVLEPLLQYLESEDLISLQENYVQTFDRTPSHSLHLFEHIHGEDRARGQAMVDLIDEYKEAGFDITSEELPDYLPLFLEFLSIIDTEKAQSLFDTAIDVINHIGKKLENNGSVYAVVFALLIQLSSIEPQPLVEPPVHDMDEAMERFGVGPDGVEPLLQNDAFQHLAHSSMANANACNTCQSTKRVSE